MRRLKNEVLQALPSLIDDSDPVLTQALETEKKSRGMTFDDVKASDYAIAHPGHAYAKGERDRGGGDHHFKKLEIGGHAAFHGGNAYGFDHTVTTAALAARALVKDEGGKENAIRPTAQK